MSSTFFLYVRAEEGQLHSGLDASRKNRNHIITKLSLGVVAPLPLAYDREPTMRPSLVMTMWLPF
jgi:hypothetical protein